MSTGSVLGAKRASARSRWGSASSGRSSIPMIHAHSRCAWPRWMESSVASSRAIAWRTNFNARAGCPPASERRAIDQ